MHESIIYFLCDIETANPGPQAQEKALPLSNTPNPRKKFLLNILQLSFPTKYKDNLFLFLATQMSS